MQKSSCQSDLGEVELERIVSGQRDHETPGQVLWQRVSMVAQEQTVVAQRRHGDADLGQVVEILQDRGLNIIDRERSDEMKTPQ